MQQSVPPHSMVAPGVSTDARTESCGIAQLSRLEKKIGIYGFEVFGAALGCSGVVFATGDLSLIRVAKQFYTKRIVHRTRH